MTRLVCVPLAALVWSAFSAAPACAQQAAAPQGPRITHEPPGFAAKGQPLSILAKVEAGSSPIKAVTLHYAPSRDAAPVKQPMTRAGEGTYVGTIPTVHMNSMPSVWYYIEAVDQRDEWAETQWQQVQVGAQRPAQPEPAATPQPPPAQLDRSVPLVRPSKENQGGMTTGKMIAGGVLAAGAAVAIIAASDSGGGGGDSGGDGGVTPTDGTGDDTPECTAGDVVGVWRGADLNLAPGFVLRSNGTAQFAAPVDGEPDSGSWGLAGCELALFPTGTNSVYQGSGTLSDDKTSVMINGFLYEKN